MMDVILHTGADHPDLLWVLVPSLLTFFAGLGIGAFSDRVRNWIRARSASTAE